MNFCRNPQTIYYRVGLWISDPNQHTNATLIRVQLPNTGLMYECYLGINVGDELLATIGISLVGTLPKPCSISLSSYT